MEQIPTNEQLTSALQQVEILQKELSREKEERAAKEASMEETIQGLQENSLAEEKKGGCVDEHLLLSKLAVVVCKCPNPNCLLVEI